MATTLLYVRLSFYLLLVIMLIMTALLNQFDAKRMNEGLLSPKADKKERAASSSECCEN